MLFQSIDSLWRTVVHLLSMQILKTTTLKAKFVDCFFEIVSPILMRFGLLRKFNFEISQSRDQLTLDHPLEV